MIPPESCSPSDDELDLLLARHYRDTSPGFEARWVALKRDLRQVPAPHRFLLWRRVGWLGAAAAVAAVVMLFTRPAAPSAPELTPQMSDLLALDATLARAQPLLDEETRAALLHLPSVGSTRD